MKASSTLIEEYVVIIYDHSKLYLDEPQIYYTTGVSEIEVRKDVYSRLDKNEIEVYDIIIISKKDIFPLTDLEVLNK